VSAHTGLQPIMNFIRRLLSIRTHSSAHSGLQHKTPFTVESFCHPVFHLIDAGDVHLVVLMLIGQNSFVMALAWSLPTFGGKL